MGTSENKTLKIMAVFTMASLVAVGAQAIPLSQDDFDRMDSDCSNVRTTKDADACLRPIYAAAMDTARDIHVAMNQAGKLHVLSAGWERECLNRDVPAYTSRNEPDRYLRTPGRCLGQIAQHADREGVSYNFSSAEFLQARIRRLLRLDLR